MNANVQKKLSEYLHTELTVSYHYMAMSQYMAVNHWPGCAAWLRVESDEERKHTLRIIDYFMANGVVPEYQELPKPCDLTGKSPADLFKDIYEREVSVPAGLQAIYEAAEQAQDVPTQNFMGVFMEEQLDILREAEYIHTQYERSEGRLQDWARVDKLLAKKAKRTLQAQASESVKDKHA